MSGSPRIQIFDIARGIALVSMAVFHFNFDLELLALKPPGYINQPHWVYFARSIATSFLILVGIGLVLGHGDGIRWPGFRLRLAKIAGAAVLITIATYFATPDIFIFFGILHNIALSSIFGLLFLRLKWWVTGTIAIIWLLARSHIQTVILDDPIWWWTGASQIIPKSSDYVPMFPWFGCVLLGIAIGRWMQDHDVLSNLTRRFDSRPMALLTFFGRNSLVFYLIHQPIMIGLLLGYVWLTGN